MKRIIKIAIFATILSGCTKYHICGELVYQRQKQVEINQPTNGTDSLILNICK